jgi:hypothetical protein
VLYDIVSSSAVEVLCFSRKTKQKNPPLNNPLKTTEIVRKKKNATSATTAIAAA